MGGGIGLAAEREHDVAAVSWAMSETGAADLICSG